MSVLPAISRDAPATEARSALEGVSWRLVGAGDWSWVLADPSDTWAARITPFDPGYRMFAELCMAGPPNRWLPEMVEIAPLARDAYIVVMQRLWPADEPAASALCAALGIANTTGYEPPKPGPAASANDPDIVGLRERLLVGMREGAQRFKLWACDIREGNVMAGRDGQLKLVDPFGIAGWKIAAALREGRADDLTDLSRQQLEDFLDIPYFGEGREGAADRESLLGQVARLFAGSPSRMPTSSFVVPTRRE